MKNAEYKMNKFEPDKDYSVIITCVGNNHASAVSGNLSGELLNEFEELMARMSAYSEEQVAKPSSDTPWRIWWKKLDKDSNVVDHGIFISKYKRESTAKSKALLKYGYKDSPYVYEVSQSVPWPELGHFMIKTYSNL